MLLYTKKNARRREMEREMCSACEERRRTMSTRTGKIERTPLWRNTRFYTLKQPLVKRARRWSSQLTPSDFSDWGSRYSSPDPFYTFRLKSQLSQVALPLNICLCSRHVIEWRSGDWGGDTTMLLPLSQHRCRAGSEGKVEIWRRKRGERECTELPPKCSRVPS